MFEIPTREKLLTYGPQIINVQAQAIDVEEYDLLPQLRSYLLNIMNRYHGVGIAAPQCGIFRQFIVLELRSGLIIEMVNPEIVQMWGHEKEGFEACLSIPPVGNGCPVARLQKVRVEFGSAVNPSWRRVEEFSGMDAIVIQHECDHLTGTFFIDRASQSRRKEVLESFQKWKIQQTLNLVSKENHAKASARPLPFSRS